MEFFPIICNIKGISPIMNKNILCIEISKSDVYIQYTNMEFEYVTFTKAKRILFAILSPTLKYSCVDNEKSVNFLNQLLTKYVLCEDCLILKIK